MPNKDMYVQEIEKRQHERLLKDSVLYYQILPGGELSMTEPHQEARLLDIGGGGLRLLADEFLDRRCQVMIKVEFSGWRDDGGNWVYTRDESDQCKLTVVGMVMWSAHSDASPGKFEVGVSFSGHIQ